MAASHLSQQPFRPTLGLLWSIKPVLLQEGHELSADNTRVPIEVGFAGTRVRTKEAMTDRKASPQVYGVSIQSIALYRNRPISISGVRIPQEGRRRVRSSGGVAPSYGSYAPMAVIAPLFFSTRERTFVQLRGAMKL